MAHIEKKNRWRLFFVALLVAGLVAGAIFIRSKIKSTEQFFEHRYTALRPKFIDLAYSQINLLEVLIIRSRDKPNQFFLEYREMTASDFESKIREQIVRLKKSVDDFEQRPGEGYSEKYLALKKSQIELSKSQIGFDNLIWPTSIISFGPPL